MLTTTNILLSLKKKKSFPILKIIYKAFDILYSISTNLQPFLSRKAYELSFQERKKVPNLFLN